mmetsp:Transcript_15614/g.46818  ORF Transcript_15614/g.46818 Transcript_15614/m.46818 type:complete len:352 (+) Transcript_15614:788-1843(+)
MDEKLHEAPERVDEVHAERRLHECGVVKGLVHLQRSGVRLHRVVLEEHHQQVLGVVVRQELRVVVHLHDNLADLCLHLLQLPDQERQECRGPLGHQQELLAPDLAGDDAAQGTAKTRRLPAQELYDDRVHKLHDDLARGRLVVGLLELPLAGLQPVRHEAQTSLRAWDHDIQLLGLAADPVRQGLQHAAFHHRLHLVGRHPLRDVAAIVVPEVDDEVCDRMCGIFEAVLEDHLEDLPSNRQELLVQDMRRLVAASKLGAGLRSRHMVPLRTLHGLGAETNAACWRRQRFAEPRRSTGLPCLSWQCCAGWRAPFPAGPPGGSKLQATHRGRCSGTGAVPIWRRCARHPRWST